MALVIFNSFHSSCYQLMYIVEKNAIFCSMIYSYDGPDARKSACHLDPHSHFWYDNCQKLQHTAAFVFVNKAGSYVILCYNWKKKKKKKICAHKIL